MKLVGLTGKAGAGKDWCYQTVFRPLGYLQWGFAWPLKQLLIAAGEVTWDEAYVTKPPAVRERLQRFGTEEGRDRFGADYWLRHADAWLKTLASAGVPGVCFTDCRFPNEFDFVRARGGKVVRMVHGAGRHYPLAGTIAAAHSSETAGDACPADSTLLNGAGFKPSTAATILHHDGVLTEAEWTRIWASLPMYPAGSP
jgi:hypothetical protein